MNSYRYATILALALTLPASAPALGLDDAWDGLSGAVASLTRDPDEGFTPPAGERLEVILVTPGERYEVDCRFTKPSQRDAFRQIPWLAPVDCMSDETVTRVQRVVGTRGHTRPMHDALHGEFRRAMAYGTSPAVRPGQRLPLAETARRVLSVAERDRGGLTRSPRWLLKAGGMLTKGAMEKVDDGLVAGLFDSWVFLVEDWAVAGPVADPAVRARWQDLSDRFTDFLRSKTRGDWDLGERGFRQLLEASIREGVALLEVPRDPWEDAMLVRDSGKWGKAYRDFGRLPLKQLWPLRPQ